MTLQSGTVDIKISGGEQITNSNLDAVLSFSVDINFVQRFTDGTGVNQSQIWVPIKTTVDTTGTTFNLNAMVHPSNLTANISNVRGIFIALDAEAADSIIIGAAGSSPFDGPMSGTTPVFQINPGGAPLIWCDPATGWDTAGASNLKIAALATTADIELLIIGVGTLA